MAQEVETDLARFRGLQEVLQDYLDQNPSSPANHM